jgi:broad specificity phosphatase PhoE
MRFRLRFVLALALAGAIAPVARAQASLVILARHAEKAAATGDPVLTAAGDIRAADLARALAGVHFAAVIATQYQRTRLTATPTADANHLTVTVVPAVADVKSGAAAVAKAINALPPGSAVLVVGHSNTLGAIIEALGGPPVADLCDAEYSTLLTLVRDTSTGGAPQLIRSRYGAAGPADDASCHPMK